MNRLILSILAVLFLLQLFGQIFPAFSADQIAPSAEPGDFYFANVKSRLIQPEIVSEIRMTTD